MGFRLGNLSCEDMQQRAGVVFPDELVQLLRKTHQDAAERVAAGRWHCFELPFVLVCGDMELAQRIYTHLAPLSSQFAQEMQICVGG